jgi:prepilin-type N-terminal cleavage/methylation domain-containing protein
MRELWAVFFKLNTRPDMHCLIPVFSTGRGARAQAKGMTLAEVVVAMAIASLTVLGLIGGYTYSSVGAEKAGLSLAANTRALERLEDTHAAIWNVSTWPVVDELAATNFPVKQVTLDLSGKGAGITYGTNYTTITQVSVAPPLRRVRVDCVWQFRAGQISSLLTNTVETLRGPD